jgi:adhesin/invasin
MNPAGCNGPYLARGRPSVADRYLQNRLVPHTLKSYMHASNLRLFPRAAIVLGALLVVSACDNPITPVVPTSITVQAGDNQEAPVGTALGVAPTVVVRDANGDRVAGVTLVVAVVSGGGSVSGPSPMTNAQGIASIGSWKMGTTAGENKLSVSVQGTGISTTVLATAMAGAPAGVSVHAGDKQEAVAGNAVTIPPAVMVRDSHGNPVAAVPVVFAVVAGGGSVSGLAAVTNAQGVATAGSWSLGPFVGANSLSATVQGTSVSTTFTATGLVGSAASISIHAGNNQSAVAGSGVVTAPAVKVGDSNGNPVPGAVVIFAVGSGGGSVTGSAATTNAQGVATIGSWTLGSSPGPNSLSATVEGSVLSVTFAATATAGAPATVAVHAGDNQSAVAGTTVPVPPAVVVKDANGHPVQGVTTIFAIASGGGMLSGSSPVTNAQGIATVGTWQLGSIAGANTLSVTVQGTTVSTTVAATGTAGTPASIFISAGNNQSATVGTNVPIAPAVLVRDAHGNRAQGVTVNFAVVSGGGSLTGASPVSNAEGIATVGSWRMGTNPGTNTMSATVQGTTLSALFAAAATPPPPASVTVQSGANQTAIAGTAVAVPPAVLVRDAGGNPLSGVNVAFAVASGGGSITGPSQVTNSQGIATVGSWTLSTVFGTQTLTASVQGVSPATITARVPLSPYAWTETNLSSFTSEPLVSVTAIDSLNVFVGTATQNRVIVGSGTQWTATTPTCANGGAVASLWADVSARHVWGVSTSGTCVMRWSAGSWVTVVPESVGALTAVHGRSGGPIYATGVNGILRRNDQGAWNRVDFSNGDIPAVPDLRSVWVEAANNVWAVGGAGMILNFNGSTWSRTQTNHERDFKATWVADDGTVGVDNLYREGSTWAQHFTLPRGVTSIVKVRTGRWYAVADASLWESPNGRDWSKSIGLASTTGVLGSSDGRFIYIVEGSRLHRGRVPD